MAKISHKCLIYQMQTIMGKEWLQTTVENNHGEIIIMKEGAMLQEEEVVIEAVEVVAVEAVGEVVIVVKEELL